MCVCCCCIFFTQFSGFLRIICIQTVKHSPFLIIAIIIITRNVSFLLGNSSHEFLIWFPFTVFRQNETSSVKKNIKKIIQRLPSMMCCCLFFFLCFGTWGRYCSAIIHYFELLLGFSVFHITLNDVKRDFASGAFRCQTFSSFFPLFFLFFLLLFSLSTIYFVRHIFCHEPCVHSQ